MKMNCKKCGEQDIVLKKDSRGLPEAHCAACGAYIKKMTVGETMAYYEEIILGLKDEVSLADNYIAEAPAEAEKPLCRYCTENFVVQYGTRENLRKQPVTINYCPICGRKVQEKDRAY